MNGGYPGSLTAPGGFPSISVNGARRAPSRGDWPARGLVSLWRTSGRAVAGGDLRGHVARRGQRGAGPGEVALADALGVSPGTAMRHAFLGGADWSGYAARRG